MFSVLNKYFQLLDENFRFLNEGFLFLNDSLVFFDKIFNFEKKTNFQDISFHVDKLLPLVDNDRNIW